MKIKLILAASKNDPLRRNDPFMPLSLPILAGSAPDHDYTFIDCLWEDDLRLDEPVDLVGISARYTAEKTAYEIADAFRKRGVLVVLGGAQISMVPHRAATFADAVAVGEGEELWPVIVDDAAHRRLKSFYVCSPHPFDPRGKTLYQTKNRPDFQTPLKPVRNRYKKRYVFDTVFASRGCHVNCDFCCVSSLFGKEYRFKPVEQVVAEIDTFRNYYYLLDDTVWGRPATYDYYLNLYREIARLKKRRYWTGQANIDAAATKKGQDVIRASVDAGYLYAAIGLESINPATLKKSGALHKTGADSIERAVDTMKKHIRFIQDQGILVSGWFVIGYEDDTLQTYHDTFAFCREMNIIPAIFYVKALQGTRLYERLEREGKLDNARMINVTHPTLNEEEVVTTLQEIARKGFSPLANIKRSLYMIPRFKKDIIHKTIFSLVTQFKLKGGIDVSHDEFYYNAGEEKNLLYH